MNWDFSFTDQDIFQPAPRNLVDRPADVPGDAYNLSWAARAPLVKRSVLFYGDEQSPLLAPRAIWSVAGKLMIADTAQNRVFIWHRLPSGPWCPPNVVLGQTGTTGTSRNAGSTAGASSLHYPSGIWSDGQKLIVADAWNHRVLIWHTFPTAHGQPADVVLGQPDFLSVQPNVAGIGAVPGPDTLNWPYGVFSDGTRLWIADTGNRRVLVYHQIPHTSFAPADAVIGKTDFHTRDYDHYEPIWPYSVRVSPNGQLCIADVQYYRVLLWHHWEKASQGQPANVVIGQQSLDGNGMNQFQLTPTQQGLSWTYDACFDQNGLWVADTGNSRLLFFNQLPQTHGAPANNLIGHSQFHTGSENAFSKYGTDIQLYWPFSLCRTNNLLLVADTGNHRAILYELNPEALYSTSTH